ncbi:hypothetical protein PybrP1_010008, partial [[Pythium] brassicae (nom. inval.)]
MKTLSKGELMTMVLMAVARGLAMFKWSHKVREELLKHFTHMYPDDESEPPSDTTRLHFQAATAAKPKLRAGAAVNGQRRCYPSEHVSRRNTLLNVFSFHRHYAVVLSIFPRCS